MAISFERFLVLTAALATASTAVAGCGGDDDDGPATGGTTAGKGNAGRGGNAGRAGATSGGSAGKSTGGTSGRGSGGSGATSGGSGEGGEAGQRATAGAGGESAEGGAPAAGGTANGGEPGTSGAGAGGEPAANGGAGGAPDELCFGDEAVTDCFFPPEGELPTDECVQGPNPAYVSCYFSSTTGVILRAGMSEWLGTCLAKVTDACTVRGAVAVDDCEKEALTRACATTAASDACADGIDLGGDVTLGSPLSVCDDGTLTQTSCAAALSAVTSSMLQEIVTCSDPAGEYGNVFSGTCAERLQQCIFPHAAIYP